MTFFQKMAEEDAEREREEQERLVRQKMHVDASCMHDTELVDNCFFSSKQKVVAQAQTVAVQMVEQALSAKTLMTNINMYSEFAKSVMGSVKKPGPLDNPIKSQRAAEIKLEPEQTERELMQTDRELITERAKEKEVDLLNSDKVNSFEEPEFFKGDENRPEPLKLESPCEDTESE